MVFFEDIQKHFYLFYFFILTVYFYSGIVQLNVLAPEFAISRFASAPPGQVDNQCIIFKVLDELVGFLFLDVALKYDRMHTGRAKHVTESFFFS